METPIPKPKGSKRERRKAKAEADLEVSFRLWVQRIQDIMNENKCSAQEAFVVLSEEVAKEQVAPQRRQQFKAAWLEFERKTKESAKKK